MEQLRQILQQTLVALEATNQRVAALEQSCAALAADSTKHGEVLMKMVTEWLPPIASKIKELREKVDTLPVAAPKKKHVLTFSNWAMIMALKYSGKSAAQIGAELDIHPSTVRKYISWDDAQIEQKRVAEFPHGVPEEILALIPPDEDSEEDDSADDAV